jgi:hypothetical protein
MSAGYWNRPKDIPGYSAEIRKKDPEGPWEDKNIEIVGISGTVLSVEYSRGRHGGYYAVSVAVIPGTESKVAPFKTDLEKTGDIEELRFSNKPDPSLHSSSGGGNTSLGDALAKIKASLSTR